ncbi:hypothetical protein BSR29_07405 [Boudabousia liubingyangii]|uniref:HTH gntR-type domain-containing protein n=1 Tax=Boudabousia liubingyangii TaxID=1921764 RepID=A0A1Q5PK98_9ACTO|nr:GntR family transcriptional regulator [Boudabousia liubingyangii]OKL46637.1 hypothetical protein BSR29_07405 [Boudabousia liubingyangii]OKL46775.1 hypothetical protein BSR28_04865 [Boudabousia liubingyangii]
MIELLIGSPEPPYSQIRVQLARQIRSGQLKPGTKLPTVRSLATQLELAAGTVARAYRDLEAAGLIETRGRRGSFTCEVTPHLPLAEWEAAATAGTIEAPSENQQTVATPSEKTETEVPQDLPDHLQMQIQALLASARAAGIGTDQLAAQLRYNGHGKS